MKFSPEDRSGCWSWPEWAARFPSQGLSPERTRRTRAQSGWWWACDGNDDGDEEGKKKDRNVQQQSDGLVYNVGDQGGRDVGQCEHGWHGSHQGCIFRLTCSYPELTEDHVLTSAYVKIFRTVTRNAVNKSVWRKKDCFWLPLNKHAVNIWLSSLRIRAHLSWRTGKHLHVLHVLRT